MAFLQILAAAAGVIEEYKVPGCAPEAGVGRTTTLASATFWGSAKFVPIPTREVPRFMEAIFRQADCGIWVNVMAYIFVFVPPG